MALPAAVARRGHPPQLLLAGRRRARGVRSIRVARVVVPVVARLGAPRRRDAVPLVVPVPVVLHDALARMRKGRGSGALVDLGTGDVPAPLLGGRRRSW